MPIVPKADIQRGRVQTNLPFSEIPGVDMRPMEQFGQRLIAIGDELRDRQDELETKQMEIEADKRIHESDLILKNSIIDPDAYRTQSFVAMEVIQEDFLKQSQTRLKSDAAKSAFEVSLASKVVRYGLGASTEAINKGHQVLATQEVKGRFGLLEAAERAKALKDYLKVIEDYTTGFIGPMLQAGMDPAKLESAQQGFVADAQKRFLQSFATQNPREYLKQYPTLLESKDFPQEQTRLARNIALGEITARETEAKLGHETTTELMRGQILKMVEGLELDPRTGRPYTEQDIRMTAMSLMDARMLESKDVDWTNTQLRRRETRSTHEGTGADVILDNFRNPNVDGPIDDAKIALYHKKITNAGLPVKESNAARAVLETNRNRLATVDRSEDLRAYNNWRDFVGRAMGTLRMGERRRNTLTNRAIAGYSYQVNILKNDPQSGAFTALNEIRQELKLPPLTDLKSDPSMTIQLDPQKKPAGGAATGTVGGATAEDRKNLGLEFRRKR